MASSHILPSRYRCRGRGCHPRSPVPDDRFVQRRRGVAKLICEIEAEARATRRGTPVLGARRILAQDPHDKPRAIRHSRRPLCHASTAGRREAYAEKYRAFVGAYISASAAYRSGQLDVKLPPYSYRPPWVTPRLLAA